VRLPKGEAAVATGVEEALTDVTPELKKRIGVLWSLANIATLIGLLGTISGLIGAFAAVGKAAAEQRSQLLSLKISEAMNNTAMGLGIAAACMIGHVFLNAASKKQQHELEAFAMKLENLLAEAPSSGGAGR
jgi:biopolymer transport protein ExbB